MDQFRHADLFCAKSGSWSRRNLPCNLFIIKQCCLPVELRNRVFLFQEITGFKDSQVLRSLSVIRLPGVMLRPLLEHGQCTGSVSAKTRKDQTRKSQVKPSASRYPLSKKNCPRYVHECLIISAVEYFGHFALRLLSESFPRTVLPLQLTLQKLINRHQYALFLSL